MKSQYSYFFLHTFFLNTPFDLLQPQHNICSPTRQIITLVSDIQMAARLPFTLLVSDSIFLVNGKISEKNIPFEYAVFNLGKYKEKILNNKLNDADLKQLQYFFKALHPDFFFF